MWWRLFFFFYKRLKNKNVDSIYFLLLSTTDFLAVYAGTRFLFLFFRAFFEITNRRLIASSALSHLCVYNFFVYERNRKSCLMHLASTTMRNRRVFPYDETEHILWICKCVKVRTLNRYVLTVVFKLWLSEWGRWTQ